MKPMMDCIYIYRPRVCMVCGCMQEVPLMRRAGGTDDDVKQAKPPPAGSVVSCCITLPDGSVCDVEISVSYIHVHTYIGLRKML